MRLSWDLKEGLYEQCGKKVIKKMNMVTIMVGNKRETQNLVIGVENLKTICSLRTILSHSLSHEGLNFIN